MIKNFTKMQGTGNDFVIFDTFSASISLSCEQIKKIADRNLGIGCDQVLLVGPSQNNGVDVYYRIFNSDGTEVSQCGNGARCVAMYLKSKGLIEKNNIIAETSNSKLIMTIDNNQFVTVNMGVPNFEPVDIPLNVDERLENYLLKYDNKEIVFGAISIGNPHAVIIVNDVESASVKTTAHILQKHGIFPEGVNVGFVQILDKKNIKVRVYERGAGETLACGSGACAAVVIVQQQGHLEEIVNVELRGGHLTIRWKGGQNPIYMSGFVEKVYEGEIEL